MFVSIYETVIGDISVSTLCYSGLYLLGNISISLAEYLLKHKATFMQEYKKTRTYMAEVFEKIPIFIVK